MIFQIVVNIILKFSIISLVGISFLFIFNTAKYYAIHHASIITLGGYFIWYFYSIIGLPFVISIFISISLTILLGLLIEFSIFRKLRKKSNSSFFMIIASLGVYIILQNLISLFFGDDSKIVRIEEVIAGNNIYGVYITNVQIAIILICLFLVISTLLFMKLTSIGKDMRAVAENEELSNIFGINSDVVILWSFGIGSAIAAIAGILIIIETDMTPSSGFNLLFYGVVAMIIGGVGNFKGLLFGALIISSAQNFGAYYLDGKWMDAIVYIILILFLIWKPLGINSKPLKKVEI